VGTSAIFFADTGESCFEVKIEADSDSMVEYPHDDMQSMGMFLFLSVLMTIVLFSSEFFHCDQDNRLNHSKFQGQRSSHRAGFFDSLPLRGRTKKLFMR